MRRRSAAKYTQRVKGMHRFAVNANSSAAAHLSIWNVTVSNLLIYENKYLMVAPVMAY